MRPCPPQVTTELLDRGAPGRALLATSGLPQAALAVFEAAWRVGAWRGQLMNQFDIQAPKKIQNLVWPSLLLLLQVGRFSTRALPLPPGLAQRLGGPMGGAGGAGGRRWVYKAWPDHGCLQRQAMVAWRCRA